MAWGYRASSYANNGAGVQIASGATTTVTLGAAASSGDMLSLHVTALNVTDGATPSITSVSDSVNGAWGTADDTVTQSVAGLGERQSVFSFPNSGAGTSVITVTLSNGNARNMNVGLECAAFSGIVTTSPLDVAVHATGTSATPSSGATAATGAANELVLGFYGDYGEGDTITEGAGYTLAGKHASDSGKWEGLMEYKDSGSSGSTPSAGVTLSATNTGWAMFAVVYKIAAGGATTTGTIAANLPSLQIAASGAERFVGTVAANLPSLQIAATGTADSGTIVGTIAANLPRLQIAAVGSQTLSGVIAANLPSLQIAASGGVIPQNRYTTTFPLTENPMSQGAIWTQGAVDATDWQNMRTTTNKVFGTQSGSSGVFDDSVALLKGTWGPDQRVSATVFNNVGAGGDYFAEVELHLRGTLSAHSALTYEVLFGINPASGKHYVEIAKWQGTRGTFFSLTGGSITIAAPATGDVLLATIVGNTITAYVNGVQVAQATDSLALSGTAPYTTGSPGLGHWLHNQTASGDPTQYGFSDYTAETLYIGTIASNLPSLQIAATGTAGGGATGTIAANLPSLQIAASGTETFTGTIAANLPSLQISATGLGQSGTIGAIAANLPSLQIAAAGTETFTGVIAANLPSLRVSAIGLVPFAPPTIGVASTEVGPPVGTAVEV